MRRIDYTIKTDGQYQVVAEADPPDEARLYRNRVRLLPQLGHRSLVWQGKLEEGDFLELEGDGPLLSLQVMHVDQQTAPRDHPVPERPPAA